MATIDLIVLGMIKKQPQSAYELQRNVEYRNISRWVRISTPSIYKKVVQLEQKGYVSSRIIRVGKQPEKAVYSITEAGDRYFLDLMEQTAGGTVSLFLDFNAVIMSLSLVSEEKREELVNLIGNGLSELQNTLTEKGAERVHIPFEGKAIMDQQMKLTETLSGWLEGLKQNSRNNC